VRVSRLPPHAPPPSWAACAHSTADGFGRAQTTMDCSACPGLKEAARGPAARARPWHPPKMRLPLGRETSTCRDRVDAPRPEPERLECCGAKGRSDPPVWRDIEWTDRQTYQINHKSSCQNLVSPPVQGPSRPPACQELTLQALYCSSNAAASAGARSEAGTKADAVSSWMAFRQPISSSGLIQLKDNCNARRPHPQVIGRRCTGICASQSLWRGSKEQGLPSTRDRSYLGRQVCGHHKLPTMHRRFASLTPPCHP
jgi:hypothetical protein